MPRQFMARQILRIVAVFALSLSMMSSHAMLQPVPALAQGPASVADLAESLLGSVVNISTSQRVSQRRPGNRGPRTPQVPDGSPFQEFFDELFPDGNNDGPRTRNSLGSGFVISEDGYIVTNNHVIADADEVTANFSDGTKLIAEVVGRDPKTDLAVLKVEPDQPLTAVEIGDSSTARIGDWVMAIGNPFGFGRTVTVGIISAIGRDINSGPYDDFIQTDASINKGNSGGPLFNMEGQVVGINTAIISPTGGSIGLGFAIPTSLARGVIDQLVEFGETRRGWLGVQIQTVTDDVAEALGLDRARGALVGDVMRGGPAEKSGMKPGDLVLSFDGKPVEEMRDLPKIVADTAVGKEVDVVVLRDSEEQTLKVEVGRLEDSERELAAATDEDEKTDGDSADAPPVYLLGLELEPVTEEMRAAEELGDNIQGLLIASVEPGSHAEDKGVTAGEIVVEVGQEPVKTIEEVKARLEELEKKGRRFAMVMLTSKTGDVRQVALRIGG